MQEARRRPTRRNPRWVHAVERAARLSPRTSGLKSVGHSTMALAEVVGPYLDSPADQSWRGPMLAYRSRMQSALDGLEATDMPADWRATNSDTAVMPAPGTQKEAGALVEAWIETGATCPN